MSNLTYTFENDPNSANELKEDNVKDQLELEEKVHQLEVKNGQLEMTVVEIQEGLKILKNQLNEVYLITQACGCSFLKNHEHPVDTEIIDQDSNIVYDNLVDTSDLEESVETDQIETPDDDDTEKNFNRILGLQNLSSTPLIALPNWSTTVQHSNDSASYSNFYWEGSELLEKYHTSLPSMVELETPILVGKPSTPGSEPMEVVGQNEVISVQVYQNHAHENLDVDDKENQPPERPATLEIPSPNTNDRNFIEKQMRIITAPDFTFDDPWISKELIECQNILNQMRDAQNEELGSNSNDGLLLLYEDKKIVEEKPTGSVSDYITPLQRPEVKKTRMIIRRNLNLNSSPRPRPTIYQSAERQGPETRSMKKRVSFAASCIEKNPIDDGKIVGKYRQMKNKKQNQKSPTKAKLIKRSNSKDKPFKCSTCSKKFDQFLRFETHLRVHTVYNEEKPYKCIKCTKSFTLPEHLALHFRAHSGEKPFTCTRCLKKFTRKSSLQRHKLTQHLLTFKFHFCKICSKYYRSKWGLSKHTQNVHNIKNDDTINQFKYTKFE